MNMSGVNLDSENEFLKVIKIKIIGDIMNNSLVVKKKMIPFK